MFDVTPTLTAASGAEVIPMAFHAEEDDSALAFADYMVDGHLAGYIMRSPSGRKYSVSLADTTGFIGPDHRTLHDAEEALLSHL